MKITLIILWILFVLVCCISFFLYKSMKNQLYIMSYYACQDGGVRNLKFKADKENGAYYEVTFKDDKVICIKEEDVKYLINK